MASLRAACAECDALALTTIPHPDPRRVGEHCEDGACAAMLITTRTHHVIGHLGDAGGLLFRGESVAHVTALHLPSSKDETARIVSAGSTVTGYAKPCCTPIVLPTHGHPYACSGLIDGHIAASRGFGFYPYKQHPRRQPDQQAVSMFDIHNA